MFMFHENIIREVQNSSETDRRSQKLPAWTVQLTYAAFLLF
jgi:hypothetical protein